MEILAHSIYRAWLHFSEGEKTSEYCNFCSLPTAGIEPGPPGILTPCAFAFRFREVVDDEGPVGAGDEEGRGGQVDVRSGGQEVLQLHPALVINFAHSCC